MPNTCYSPTEKSPLPISDDEGKDSFRVELIDEGDLENQSAVDYVPFDPKGLYVFFGSNQTYLTKKSKTTLSKIIMGMRQDPLSRIIIRAHADSVGSRKRNLELSRLRAEGIRDYLVENGIESNRLRVDFAGEAETVQKSQDAEDRSRSRRAEFILDYNLKKQKK